MEFEKDLGHIERMFRNLAWTYHKVYGEDSQELYQVAMVKWFYAHSKYDPKKGAKRTTYAFRVGRNAMQDHVNQEAQHRHNPLEQEPPYEPRHIPTNYLQRNAGNLSDRAKTAIDLCQKLEPLLFEPGITFDNPFKLRKLLKSQLMKEHGWTEYKVSATFKEIKDMLRASV